MKRVQAVNALAVLRPDPTAVALLNRPFADKVAGVRQSACVVAGQIKARAAIPTLQAALNDKVNEVVFEAARALYAMGDSSGRAVIQAVLLGERSDASGFISGGIRDMKLKLHDPGQVLVLSMESAAGFFGPASAGFPLAEGLVKDKNASGQTVAALLLATDTTPESLNALRRALLEKNWTVRAAAARAIGMRNATELYDDLTKLLDDKRDEVRYSAAASLMRLKQAADSQN